MTVGRRLVGLKFSRGMLRVLRVDDIIFPSMKESSKIGSGFITFKKRKSFLMA